VEPSDSIDVPTEPRSGNFFAPVRRTRGLAERRRWVSLLGRPGWLALIGLALALVLAVFLGFFILSAVERNLLDSRTDLIMHVAEDLMEEGVIDRTDGLPTDLAELDAAVRLHLLGTDVFGVVLWDRSSTIVYSDAPELIGRKVTSDEISDALEGSPIVATPHSTDDEFALPPGHTSAYEFYVPIVGSTGRVLSVLEVYEDAAPINSTLTSTRRMVWLSILLGLGVLFVFLLLLSRASLGALDARRRQAERLVASMSTAQEDERTRIIGSLHDDIGQPLYRVLYGIEGSLSRIDPDSPVNEELVRIGDLVRRIDDDLRSELLMLHQGAIHENNLDTLLQRLVEDVQAESQVEISLAIGPHVPLAEGPRAALFRATREAVTNARKHSGASVVEINVTEGSHRVIVDVEDDGRGLAGDPGLGLRTTRERLEALGGGLKVIAGTGGGTLFRAWVPVSPGGGEQ